MSVGHKVTYADTYTFEVELQFLITMLDRNPLVFLIPMFSFLEQAVPEFCLEFTLIRLFPELKQVPTYLDYFLWSYSQVEIPLP